MDALLRGVAIAAVSLGLGVPAAAARAQAPPAATAVDTLPPIAHGTFAPTAASLKEWRAPDWFRDAKFGIWAHWGPQAVPRAGDWYARNMYLQGHPQYEQHLKKYGHPSVAGYKDIIPLWKAEKWEPDSLMALYVKAGAKYFVTMGVHHDNFDLWNSKYHTWNAVAMGPHRDVVGEWKRAAVRYHLPFGVSEHLGPSFAWFSPSHGWDQWGPKAGVPYDGQDPRYAELYHPANNEPFRWGRSWYATDPQWHQEWFTRIKDLIDQYHPDLLYTDGGIPFGSFGRSIVAHLYNTSEATHGGRLEAVYTHKDLGTGEFIREAGAQDVERGVLNGINPFPWQTDTSIGDWFYSDDFPYKSTSEVVHTLTDIVSKNGNLLLNVVLYADGSLPPKPRRFLDEMGAWMAVNGEAIYGTRPWTIYGEGPTEVRAGAFNESDPYTPQDIRFTTKGSTLYAITLGVPTGELRIKALGRTATATTAPVARVQLVGSPTTLMWTQEADALVIHVPTTLPSLYSAAFRITFARGR